MDIKEIKNGLIYNGVVHELVSATPEDLKNGVVCDTCSLRKECDNADILVCGSFGDGCRNNTYFKLHTDIHIDTRLQERNYIARELFIRRNGEMLNDSFNAADAFMEKCYGLDSKQK